MNMRLVTIVYAVLMILLGLIGYFGLGRISITALIPAFFGIVICLIALIAADPNRLKHAMHISTALALIAFLATIGGLYKMLIMLSGGGVVRPAATISQGIMALLSFLYVSMAVRSFVTARLLKGNDN
nr:hypothetical protein [candidate division Zixibacteria bacterium]